jgi:hypothetical protein
MGKENKGKETERRKGRSSIQRGGKREGPQEA